MRSNQKAGRMRLCMKEIKGITQTVWACLQVNVVKSTLITADSSQSHCKTCHIEKKNPNPISYKCNFGVLWPYSKKVLGSDQLVAFLCLGTPASFLSWVHPTSHSPQPLTGWRWTELYLHQQSKRPTHWGLGCFWSYIIWYLLIWQLCNICSKMWHLDFV